ncbi:MAG: LacI family transcriptional regulator [Alphaproteobacteria bacterium]|nr:MAG: LacI family transcriptional regulator [Alphaproteobacteria bacterium]
MALPPLVVAGQLADPEAETLSGVRIDNRLAFQEATSYLISLGHRSFCFLRHEDSSLFFRDTELGIRDALDAHDLAPTLLRVTETGNGTEHVRSGVRRLLNTLPHPTSIICGNDDIAIAALAELRSAGVRVPEDISVLGCDDIRYAAISEPPLTTIGQSSREIGEKAVYSLLKAIRHPDTAMEYVRIAHRLIIRDSVAPPITALARRPSKVA